MNILLALILSFAFSSLIAQHQHISGDGYADSVNKGLIAKDTMKGSPKRVAMKSIGNTHIHIEYGSPGVKGRMIWGGLVAYEQHLADAYNVSEDIVRVKVKPIKKAQATQRLTYSVIPSGKDAGVMIEWEYLKVVLPIKVS